MLTIYDDLSMTPFETLNFYNILTNKLEAKQVDSRLNNFLVLIAVILYLILQYLIERDADEERKKELSSDRWTCVCVVFFFVFIGTFTLGFNPKVDLMIWRINLQITWMIVFLLRYIIQKQNLFERIKNKFGNQPLIEVLT